MGKRIVIVGVILSFATAILIFFTRNTESLRQNMEKNAAQRPRLILEDFTSIRYQGFDVKASLSADLGNFYEPNHIKLDGNVRGERFQSAAHETIRADTAHAYLETTSLSSLDTSGSKLSRAEIEDNVILKVRQDEIHTEYAEYIENKKTLSSRRPVKVQGPNRTFEGDDGFDYQIDREILTMSGLIKGEIKNHATN